MNPATVTCALSGKSIPSSQAIRGISLRPTLFEFIRKSHPQLDPSDWIALDLLPAIRADFVENAISEEIGEITALEREVIDSVRQEELLAQKPLSEDKTSRSFGEHLADRIASYGGSWRFIIAFCCFLAFWITLNSLWNNHPPDPYPFILLNLLLSCIAALQAPIIMMSQNRQEARDREHAEQDYQINLKAELGIRHLHEKIDHLLHHHGERLLEIQTIQTQLLEQLLAQSSTNLSKDHP